MTLSAVKPGGWAVGEILTSDQMDALQALILQAVDGVNGGTYTLTAPLIFAGEDVGFLSGSTLSIANGATGTVDGDLSFTSNADVTFGTGSILSLAAGAEMQVVGDIDINSGGQVNFNAGSRVDINSGAEMQVEGTGFIRVAGEIQITSTGDLEVEASGEINVQVGGEINVAGAIVMSSGGHITGLAGSFIALEDAEDLTINDQPEGFRTTLVPFGFIPTGWEAQLSGKLTWEQSDVGSDWAIAFPLAVRPGDTLVDVYVAFNGESGHVGLPAQMPVIRLVRAALDGSYTTLATRTDQSPDVATYQGDHYVILQTGALDSGAMPQLATPEPLYVLVQGETGANSAAGLEITSITGNIIARSFRGADAIYS